MFDWCSVLIMDILSTGFVMLLSHRLLWIEARVTLKLVKNLGQLTRNQSTTQPNMGHLWLQKSFLGSQCNTLIVWSLYGADESRSTSSWSNIFQHVENPLGFHKIGMLIWARASLQNRPEWSINDIYALCWFGLPGWTFGKGGHVTSPSIQPESP